MIVFGDIKHKIFADFEGSQSWINTHERRGRSKISGSDWDASLD